MKWGEGLQSGMMVEVWGSKTAGLILERDPEHIYLWKVFHENTVFSFHSSRLRVFQM